MSFKTILKMGLGITLLLTTACSQVGEKPPAQKEIEGLESTKCMNTAADNLKNFFEAKVSDRELMGAWACLDTAFQQFAKYVRGKEKDRYQSSEIVEFLENYFFEDKDRNKITPEFQVEIMKIKQIFLGGDTQYVTRDELRRSKDFIQSLSAMTVALNPHMKIIVMDWKPKLDSDRSKELEEFENANKAMQKFAVELSQLILRNKSLYRINDILSLFQEFEKFFAADWDWVEDLEKLLPGLRKLKMALGGGNEMTIDEKEWEPVLTMGARGYFQYLRYHYFIKTTHETGGAIRLIYIARTMDDVFSIFQDLIARKQTGSVTNREVYEILNAFEQFWTEMKVSEKLIFELMKVKRVLIGGGTDAWTSQDFASARMKVPELRRIVENFMPYYSVYISEWDPSSETPEEARKIFAEASEQLTTSAQDLGKFFEGAYSYDDLLELTQEFNNLYPNKSFFGPKKGEADDKRKSFYATFQQFRETFVVAKKMLFGQEDTIIERTQWPSILAAAARGYSTYSYYSYFLEGKDFKKTESIQDTGVLFHQGVSIVENLLKDSPTGKWHRDDLARVTSSITGTDLIENKIKLDTATRLWHAILNNFLNAPEKRLAGQGNEWLGAEQLDILKFEFEMWKKSQLVLNATFSPNTDYNQTQVLALISSKVQEYKNDSQVRPALEALYNQLNSTATATWDSEDRLEISNRVAWKYKSNALFNGNLTRAVARLLMRAFSGEPTLARVNECETQAGYDNIVGLFRDLKIFDPSETFVNSRFLESNIFTSRANGDKFLDYPELTDLINVIFSGLRTNDKLEKSLKSVCKVYKNAEGKEFVRFNCLREHHYVAARKFMTQLPEFTNYVGTLTDRDQIPSRIHIDDDGQTTLDPSPQKPSQKSNAEVRAGYADWSVMFRETLKSTGWAPNKGIGDVKEESVLLSEALYYPFVVQYTELLYSRFDSVAKDGKLTAVEVEKAFPVFKSLLKELAAEQLKKGTIKEGDLLAVFTYILNYIREPSADSFSSIKEWLTWKLNFNDLWSRSISLNRKKTAEVLGFIADKARKNSETDEGKPVCGKTTRIKLDLNLPLEE